MQVRRSTVTVPAHPSGENRRTAKHFSSKRKRRAGIRFHKTQRGAIVSRGFALSHGRSDRNDKGRDTLAQSRTRLGRHSRRVLLRCAFGGYFVSKNRRMHRSHSRLGTFRGRAYAKSDRNRRQTNNRHIEPFEKRRRKKPIRLRVTIIGRDSDDFFHNAYGLLSDTSSLGFFLRNDMNANISKDALYRPSASMRQQSGARRRIDPSIKNRSNDDNPDSNESKLNTCTTI